jgi:hypothetical protein
VEPLEGCTRSGGRRMSPQVGSERPHTAEGRVVSASRPGALFREDPIAVSRNLRVVEIPERGDIQVGHAGMCRTAALALWRAAGLTPWLLGRRRIGREGSKYSMLQMRGSLAGTEIRRSSRWHERFAGHFE